MSQLSAQLTEAGLSMQNKALIINYPSSENDFRLHIIKKHLKDFYTVDTCINPLWGNYKTKTDIANNPFYVLKYFLNEFWYLLKLLFKVYRHNYDLIIVGYPAYFEAFILKVFVSKKTKKKIYIDFFISLYDTLILDRKSFHQNSVNAKIFYFFDKQLLKCFKQILVDTQANAKRFAEMFKIDYANFQVLFVGSNNLVINRVFEFRKKNDGFIHLGWVGAIIPLHGIDEIIKCAEIVKNENIKFHIIGNGPNNELKQIENTINFLGLNNVVLYNELDFEKTMDVLSNCDICLGIFGKSDKAKSVIPFKLFDYLYLNKPIITQYSDAVLEISEFEQINMVKNSASAIADQIHKIDLNKSIDNRDLLIRTLNKQYKKVFSVT